MHDMHVCIYLHLLTSICKNKQRLNNATQLETLFHNTNLYVLVSSGNREKGFKELIHVPHITNRVPH